MPIKIEQFHQGRLLTFRGPSLPAISTDSDRKWYRALGVSTLLHVGLLASLCLLQAELVRRPEAAGLDTRWQHSDGETDEPVIVETVELEVPDPAQPKLSAARSSIASIPVPIRTDRPQIEVSTHNKQVSVWNEVTGLSDDLSEEVAVITPTRAGAGDDQADGAGAGHAFFGQQNVDGQRVVYVLDGSQSMNHPHPSDARTRFGRVKLELLQSVRGMQSNQRFFVIFFNQHAIPMPARELIRVDESEPYLRWMARVSADGKTDPTEALLLALRLQPDVIYFLSDGGFRPEVVDEVARLNRNQVAIHTFCLSDREGEPLLRQIAAVNGGRYRFIP